MGYFQRRGTAWLMMMIVSLCVSMGVSATNYQVGDGQWSIKSYDSWLSGKTFKVGDTLEFVYESSQHNVVEVDKADYESCSAGNGKVQNDGDTKLSLSSAGIHYYICSVTGHCESGMKLAVTVQEASTTPSTTPSTPSTTPSPPPPSSTSSPLSLSPTFFFFPLLLALGLSALFFKP